MAAGMPRFVLAAIADAGKAAQISLIHQMPSCLEKGKRSTLVSIDDFKHMLGCDVGEDVAV
jgi:hypothetical protein